MKFEPGLTSIVGPNGSGKTNAVSAMYAGITGDWSRFEHDRRENIISQYAKDNELSGVRVLMEHQGVRAEITRTLRPNARSLVIGSEDPITSDKAITTKIENWFGLPIKVIGQYIFVNQWEMFSILNESPTERSKDLYRLFGIEQAEACWVAIGDHMKELNEKIPDIDVDSVRTRILANRNKLRDLETKLRELNGKATADDKLESLRSKVSEWNHKYDLEEEISNLDHKIIEINAQLFEEEKYLDALSIELNGYKEQQEKLEARWQSCAGMESAWANYRSTKSTRDNIERKLLVLDREEESRPEPQVPNSLIPDDKIGSVERRLKEAKRSRDRAEEFLKAIHEGVPSCPICHTPTELLKDQINKYKLELEVLEPEIDLLARSLAVTHRYKTSKTIWDSWKATIGSRRIDAKLLLSELPDVEKPPVPEEDVQALKKYYLETKQLVRDGSQELQNKRNLVSRLHGERKARADDRDKRYEELNSINITQEEVEAAEAVLAVSQLDSQVRSRLQTEISVIKRAITDDEVSLEEATQVLKSAERVSNLRNELTAVRDVMHREALPRMVAQSQLSLLETQMNKSLEELGIDFRVQAKDGLKFQVVFNDGIRRVPAETLSGGEKVVFALAWRLAVNAEFASDIGVLCLDEPTAGLDRDRLGCLKLAIEKMKTMSQARGLQCIIITHADGLMPLFDRVIELHPPQLL